MIPASWQRNRPFKIATMHREGYLLEIAPSFQSWFFCFFDQRISGLGEHTKEPWARDYYWCVDLLKQGHSQQNYWAALGPWQGLRNLYCYYRGTSIGCNRVSDDEIIKHIAAAMANGRLEVHRIYDPHDAYRAWASSVVSSTTASNNDQADSKPETKKVASGNQSLAPASALASHNSSTVANNTTGNPDTAMQSPPPPVQKITPDIPAAYLETVSEAMGISVVELQAKYDALEATGADYKTLLNKYVDTNPYGIDLTDAHFIMGYTTNFFQKSLNRRLLSGTDFNGAENRLVDSINLALDKLPSQSGTFYRGLGSVPDSFDQKYAVGRVVHEKHFASVSEELSPNYPANRVMVFESDNVKDISALAMDTNFAPFIGQEPTKSEHLIQANSRFTITSNDGKIVKLKAI